MTKGKGRKAVETPGAAPPVLGDLVYREGNVYRLKERRGDLWVWDVGILAREGDREALGEATDLLAVRGEDGMERVTPGRFYWLLEANIPHDYAPLTVWEWTAIGGRLTAVSEELYRDLEALVEDLSTVALDGGDGVRSYTLTPKGRLMVRNALLPPGEEGEPWTSTAPPGLVDAEGHPIKPRSIRISAPGGYLANPSDVISHAVTKVIALPKLLAINPDLRQVEYSFPLAKSKKAATENRQGRVVYHPPPDWGEEFTDPILGELLKEAHDMDREDLFLYSLIMNELPRHGPQGFPLGLETIRKAKGTQRSHPHGAALAEELVALHQRLHRLARIAVYAPSNVYISGRYFKGTPFQGGGLINVGHPTAYMPTLAGKPIPAEWHIQPGPVGLFLCQEFGITGNRPQFGIFPETVFRLDLERREGAFRMALPIAQLWRVRAGKAADLERTWKPRNLFEMAGISLPKDRRKYQQWLERRETDLEALEVAGLLQSWEWGPEWAADLVNMTGGARREPGWFDHLLDEGRLILDPHPAILRQYADAGLQGAARYLAKLIQRPGVEAPVRSLPSPTRRARQSQRPKPDDRVTQTDDRVTQTDDRVTN